MTSTSVIGLGYVGLSTAVSLAFNKVRVVGVDSDTNKLSQIGKGIAPFYEPKLQSMLRNSVNERWLTLTNDIHEAISETDLTFITVGTPNSTNGAINLEQVKHAATSISHAIRKKNGSHLIVIKSTVTPGTTKNIIKPILDGSSATPNGRVALVVNPEFLRQGDAMQDTLKPNVIVIGSDNKNDGDTLENFYRRLNHNRSIPVIRTNSVTAELIKYANNAFLAMKITYINTMANICEKTPGADVETVAKAIGFDRRIGPLFLRAGLGYGGSCFPKDLKALITSSAQRGYRPTLLEIVQQVNEDQPLRAVELAKKLIGSLKHKKITVLGLAFKPGTDDMREAVSLKIIRKLIDEGASVIAHDPKALENAKKILGNSIDYAETALEALSDADCCIIVTEWDEYRKLKPKDFVYRMRSPGIVDGRRTFNPKDFIGKVKFAAIGLGQQR